MCSSFCCYADTSKRRQKVRNQLSSQSKQIKSLAEAYCMAHPDISIEMITEASNTMKFPWSTKSCCMYCLKAHSYCKSVEVVLISRITRILKK